MSEKNTTKAEKFKFGLLLSYITVGYNVVEGIVSVILGSITGSIALVGFGLDSFIESLSGSVMIWRLRKHGKISEEDEEAVEAKAATLIGVTFFILAIYVLYEALKSLMNQDAAEPSLFGIMIAILSLLIMPFLAYQKNKVGKEIGSHSLIADSKQTIVCVMMSIALLIGLAANYLFGVWWLDSVAGLFFVVICQPPPLTNTLSRSSSRAA